MNEYTPEGWQTVVPRIVARNANRLIEFLHEVLGATGEYQENTPSLVTIGNSTIMISEAGVRTPMTAFLYVYVSDADAAYQRAVNAGVRVIEEPLDTPYGDRRCMVEDEWGNTWQIATYRGS